VSGSARGERIRAAEPTDAAALVAIYAPFVRDTPVSFEQKPPSTSDFAERVEKVRSRWAWLVAEQDGAILGYAYGTEHRIRAAYRYSVETSVYVAPSAHRRGVGRRLYAALLERLTTLGYCNAYAGITLPNVASVCLHEGLGFRSIGVFPRVGWKLGAWHDVGWWHLGLRDAPPMEDTA